MATKDLLDLIKIRRSVRIFTGKKVSKKDIELMIEAGIWAPTGCNMQELRFLVLDKPKDIKLLDEFKPFFQGVSHYILLFIDMSTDKAQERYVKHRHEWKLPHMDAGLALMNMALMAKNLGLETCVFNLSEIHFAKPKLTNLLDKIILIIKRKFNWQLTSLENSFEWVTRNKLKIPANLKVVGGLAVGYGKFIPDPKKIFHGGKILQRKPVKEYLIRKNV